MANSKCEGTLSGGQRLQNGVSQNFTWMGYVKDNS